MHPRNLLSPYRPLYIPLTEPDVEEAARLYTEVFSADEPTTRRRAPDPVLFLSYARSYVGYLAGKELSFVARDEQTGKLAGFIFCVDLADDLAGEGAAMASLLAEFREVVAMIDELEDRYLNRAEISPGSVLHVFQIGIARPYRKCGIAEAIIRRVVVHARERGYSQVVADCTGPVSRMAFERCGFREAGFSPYEAFSTHGVRFFAGLDGGISLMVRDV